jgi:hypothetical protein
LGLLREHPALKHEISILAFLCLTQLKLSQLWINNAANESSLYNKLFLPRELEPKHESKEKAEEELENPETLSDR